MYKANIARYGAKLISISNDYPSVEEETVDGVGNRVKGRLENRRLNRKTHSAVSRFVAIATTTRPGTLCCRVNTISRYSCTRSKYFTCISSNIFNN